MPPPIPSGTSFLRPIASQLLPGRRSRARILRGPKVLGGCIRRNARARRDGGEASSWLEKLRLLGFQDLERHVTHQQGAVSAMNLREFYGELDVVARPVHG